MRRRQWLKVGAAFAVGPILRLPSAQAASERIRLGMIGVGNQGQNNLKEFLPHVVAVCDVDRERRDRAAAAVQKANGKCVSSGDFRQLLDDPNIDAVVITTPDHWHAAMTTRACAAGKDVYCEKPLSLTVREGRRMVEAARAHQRIVQTGSQQRSDDRFRLACELVRNGRLGKIGRILAGISGVNFKGPPVADSQPPEALDYNFWLGPAPERPYNRLRVHYNFRFFWDYSGGQLTNWGAHNIDIAHWAMGMDASGPIEVRATAQFHPDRWYEVPESFKATYRYANGVEVIAGMGLPGGVTFEGSEGTLSVSRKKIAANPPEILRSLSADGQRLERSARHSQNWLECIRSRRLPIADVEIGHRTATACHLGNIAIWTDRAIRWNPEREAIVGDDAAAARLDRPHRAPWSESESRE